MYYDTAFVGDKNKTCVNVVDELFQVADVLYHAGRFSDAAVAR